MTKVSRTCFILAKAGPLRDSLRALVSTVAEIQVIGETDDDSLALQIIAERCPDLVLVDAGVADDVDCRVLRQIKSRSPQTRRLLLVDTVQQKQAAESPAAEEIVLTGTMAGNLTATIERLLAARA